jgi:hypothetical protein
MFLTATANSDYKTFHYWKKISPKDLNILEDKISVSRLVNKKLSTLRRPIFVGKQLLNNNNLQSLY